MSNGSVRTNGALIALVLAICAGAVSAAPRAELWPLWLESNAASSTQVSHQSWQELLDRYLLTTSDARTVFRYDAVTADDRRRLQRYVSELTAIDPRELTRDEQLPYWINLYNALTVEVVLSHPAKPSILRMGGGWLPTGPWDDKLVSIAGHDVTLNDIEHRILRPIWKDLHIHYALNCASVGCPNLAPTAFTRDNAKKIMESGEFAYLNHPRGVHFTEDGVLRLSSLFDWYQEDFGTSNQALLDYLAGERPELAKQLTGYRGEIEYHYDWSLNSPEQKR